MYSWKSILREEFNKLKRLCAQKHTVLPINNQKVQTTTPVEKRFGKACCIHHMEYSLAIKSSCYAHAPMAPLVLLNGFFVSRGGPSSQNRSLLKSSSKSRSNSPRCSQGRCSDKPEPTTYHAAGAWQEVARGTLSLQELGNSLLTLLTMGLSTLCWP